MKVGSQGPIPARTGPPGPEVYLVVIITDGMARGST